MFHQAEEYQQRGWSVIPLLGKRAAIEWKEFQARRPTLGEIAHWFGVRSRIDYNIGVVTGAISDLVVVDADEIEAGRKWFSEHPTPLVSTTSKGAHLWYRHPSQEVRNRVQFVTGLDLRGDGGYVAAPPSIHPSGKRYEWVEFTSKLEEMPVFDPAWIPTRTVGAPERTMVRTHPVDRIERARAYIGKITAVSGSGGHKDTFRAACKLKEFELTTGQAWEVLKEWNRTNSEPAWSEKELRHKLDDAFGVRDD